MGKCLSPFIDEIFGLLLVHITSPRIQKKVKPDLVACIGEIAFALGNSFNTYTTGVLKVFQKVAQNISNQTNKAKQGEHVDMRFSFKMAESLLMSISSIIQAVNSKGKLSKN